MCVAQLPRHSARFRLAQRMSASRKFASGSILVATPATLVVIFAVVVLVAAGIAAILAGGDRRSERRNAASIRCESDNCGHENRRDARFCANCGAPLGSAGADAATTIGNPTQARGSEPRPEVRGQSEPRPEGRGLE